MGVKSVSAEINTTWILLGIVRYELLGDDRGPNTSGMQSRFKSDTVRATGARRSQVDCDRQLGLEDTYASNSGSHTVMMPFLIAIAFACFL